MNIQIRHIRAFIAVAQAKNFARAAKQLHVSQPALSQTIIQLEQDVGFSLFERTTRSVTLTPAGENVLVKALILKESMDGFHDEVRAVQSHLKSELRVGFMIGNGVQLLPAIVREFEKLRPEASLHLEEFDFSDPSAGLRDRKVDCAIIRPPIGVDDIDLVEMSREKCVACLPSEHRLSGCESVTLDDILDEPIVAATGRGVWRDYWLASDYRRNRPANVSLEVSTIESELQAIASGKGISITSQSTAMYYSRPGVVFKTILDMQDCVVAIGSRRTSNRLIADFISVAKRVSGSIPKLGPPDGVAGPAL
jgi:DNA-binding transcriptional LysR family regulator